MQIIQEKLDLFSPPAFEEILTAKKIRGITVTFNNRLRKSWHCTIKPDKFKTLVLPSLLKESPEEVKNAVITWALLVKPRLKSKRKEYYQQKRFLENIVWNYLEEQGVKPKRKVIADPEKFNRLTVGVRYDLRELFKDINQHYFDGKLTSYIRWGSPASKTSYQSMYRDKKGNRFSLITIAGAYNHPKVPEFAIKGVLFHEMLHIGIPPYKKNGRNIMHGPEFKKGERLYKDLRKWLVWEKEEIHKIIRSLRRGKKKGKFLFGRIKI